MKKIEKHGFTLIELIVVLVILAIIALIVTPIVLNIVEKAEDSARKRSVDAYGHAIDLAVASYELDYGNYPNSLDNLKIDYSGDEVKCNVKIIRKSGDVYLSECSTQGVKVKDKKTEDGYYHYGKDEKEYVDLYGESLEKQINDYIKKNGNAPTDFSKFDNKYSGDVSCEIKIINDDNTLYLSKCQVDDMLVRDESRDDGYYHYGEIKVPIVEALLSKANDVSVTTYTEGNTHEMYTFTHDATTQTEALTDYRYIGNDPYNYVTFNNELWRIIGVFTVEDENGNQEQRIKIIRNEPIGNYAWNSSKVHEWPTASLQTYLNGDYYNSLSDEAKAMLGDTKYYLGGGGFVGGAVSQYTFERGTTVYSGRSTNWIGKIALMYPSDYAYTYSNGVDNKCYTDTFNCRTSNTDSIPSNGWLYNRANQWLISPSSGAAPGALFVDLAGGVGYNDVPTSRGARPSAYLLSSIQLDKGTGTKDDPYTLKQA